MRRRNEAKRVEPPYVWPNDQFGPWPRPSIEDARVRVRQAVLVTDTDPDSAAQRERLVEHIAATGDCVWHACHEVYKTPLCYCSPCTKVRQVVS